MILLIWPGLAPSSFVQGFCKKCHQSHDFHDTSPLDEQFVQKLLGYFFIIITALQLTNTAQLSSCCCCLSNNACTSTAGL